MQLFYVEDGAGIYDSVQLGDNSQVMNPRSFPHIFYSEDMRVGGAVRYGAADGVTSVTSDSTASYNIITSVVADAYASYSILTAGVVISDSFASYVIRAAVYSDRTASYNINSDVSTDTAYPLAGMTQFYPLAGMAQA